jgi:hypothetical protein
MFNKLFFEYEQLDNILYVYWNKKALNITDIHFNKELLRLSEVLLYLKPKKLFVDIVNLNHYITPENQNDFLQIMIPTYKKIDLKKLSIFLGEDLFKQFFVSDLINEEQKQINFQAQFFNNIYTAKKWIME